MNPILKTVIYLVTSAIFACLALMGTILKKKSTPTIMSSERKLSEQNINLLKRQIW